MFVGDAVVGGKVKLLGGRMRFGLDYDAVIGERGS